MRQGELVTAPFVWGRSEDDDAVAEAEPPLALEPGWRRRTALRAAPRLGSSRTQDDLRGQLPDGVVDELLAGAKSEERIVGPGGLLAQLTKRPVEIQPPRDRDGSFEPKLVRKRQRRFEGMWFQAPAAV